MRDPCDGIGPGSPRWAIWWALRRWSRARWTGGGASRHRESPGGLEARCAVGTIGSPRTGDFGEQLNSGHAAAPRRARPTSSWFPHSSSLLHPGPRCRRLAACRTILRDRPPHLVREREHVRIPPLPRTAGNLTFGARASPAAPRSVAALHTRLSM